MTNEQLDEIRERAEAATPGPWTYEPAEGGCSTFEPCPKGKEYEDADCPQCAFWAWDRPACLNRVQEINTGALRNHSAFGRLPVPAA